MVTGLFPEDEPLRRSIRHKANRLLEVLLSLRRAGVSANSVKWSWQELAADLVSGLNLAWMGGLLSEMNSSVLIRELNSLSERMAGLRDEQVPGGSVLTASFFEPPAAEERKEVGQSASSDRRSSVSGSAKAGRKSGPGPRADFKSEGSLRPAASGSAGAKDATARAGENTGPNKGEKPAVQAKKSRRQHEILKVASEKGEITVKDAARTVTGCSEKTLQRELNDLVGEGVLKKEGKRRWTRYSFA